MPNQFSVRVVSSHHCVLYSKATGDVPIDARRGIDPSEWFLTTPSGLSLHETHVDAALAAIRATQVPTHDA